MCMIGDLLYGSKLQRQATYVNLHGGYVFSFYDKHLQKLLTNQDNKEIKLDILESGTGNVLMEISN